MPRSHVSPSIDSLTLNAGVGRPRRLARLIRREAFDLSISSRRVSISQPASCQAGFSWALRIAIPSAPGFLPQAF
jgi:hypothetical protein